MSDSNTLTVKGEYTRMAIDREPYLQRARDLSKWTIPELFPPAGKKTTPTECAQSLGAQLVNALSAKVVTATLPVGQSFMKLAPDEIQLQRIAAGQQIKPDGTLGPEAPEAIAAKVDNIIKGLAKVERVAHSKLQASTFRAKYTLAQKYNLVGGNVCMYVPEKLEKSQVFNLANYVQQLDSSGNLVKLITKESFNIFSLSKKTRDACDVVYEKGKSESVDVYTAVYRAETEDGSLEFDSWQEINGIEVPDSRETFKDKELPYLVWTWDVPADGESYSFGFVSQYAGDLRALEGLSDNILMASAAASKVVFMIKPGSETANNRRALARARSGDFIEGNTNDVGPLQLEKYADLRITAETAKTIEDRLKFAFLMNSAIQRNGERVTAEEIRIMANELEVQLGGVYSTTGIKVQRPLAYILLRNLSKQGLIPPLPFDIVDVQITTGLDALGRTADAENLTLFKNDIAGIPGAESALRMSTFVSRFAVARGIDTDGLIKSNEEIAQEQKQAQMSQFMADAGSKVAPDVVKAAMAQQQQAPQQ